MAQHPQQRLSCEAHLVLNTKVVHSHNEQQQQQQKKENYGETFVVLCGPVSLSQSVVSSKTIIHTSEHENC